MRKGVPTSSPPLVCGRTFEPGRLQDQVLSEAYQHLVSGPGRAHQQTVMPGGCRTDKRGVNASVSVHSCKGVCA